MKRLLFLLFFIPLSIFGQKPNIAPAQVGTGVPADVGKVMVMDANGRGVVSPLSSALGQNLTWNIGGNAVSANSILGLTGAYDLSLITNNIERIRLKATGEVGIGTSSPAANLHIYVSDNNATGFLLKTVGNAPASSVFKIMNGSSVPAIDVRYTPGVNGFTTQFGGNIAVNGSIDPLAAINITGNVNDPSGTVRGVNCARTPTFSANNANNVEGAEFNISLNQNSFNYTGTAIGGNFVVSGGGSTSTATTNEMVAGDFLAYHTGYGIVSKAYGARFNIYNLRSSAVIQNAYYAKIDAGFNVGTIQNSYGLYIDNLPAATTNYAIYSSNTYKSYLGGALQIAGIGTGSSTDSIMTVDASGNLRKRRTSDLITATPSLAATIAISNNTNNALNFPYGSGIGAGIGTETYSRWGQNRYRYGLNIGSNPDQYSNGLVTSLSSYGAVNLATADSTRLRIAQNGNIGINTLNPQAMLDVNGTMSVSGTTYLTSSLSSALWGNIDGVLVKNNTDNSIRYASKSLFLNNGGQSNTAPVYFGTNDDYTAGIRQNGNTRVSVQTNTTNISNSQYTELATTNTTNTQPSVRLSNGRAMGVNIFVSADINQTIGNAGNQGDLIINPNTGNAAMVVNYNRKDLQFGLNHQQKSDVSFVDGSDTARVALSDSTGYLRLFKGTAVTTTKVKVTLPSNPQAQSRIAVLCEDDMTGVIFAKSNAAQTILGADTFSVISAGDRIELIFIYNEFPVSTNTGHWYIKKL